ncbi:hypothetical protein IPJ72_02480 [Candidatus Peregrinibacteria bacterium]|nr:MAG: hypothetical protein IPJ72_02480 [Candidatus Peregrinibacteria bacterium]
MEYKTNPWSIVLSVAITAIISGGGIYLWQTQNSSIVTPVEKEEVNNESSISPPITEDEIISEKTPATQLSLKGVIHYRIDGSAWLEIDDFKKYDIQIQDTTVVKNIPENLLDERIKKIMKETGQDHPWFGLMSSISSYIKEGSVVQIEGAANKVIADEISVLE